MEKFRLGRTGLMVTRLGVGGIPIQRLSEDCAVEVMKHCLDLGINFIDTANGYTTSEERIGRAVAGRRYSVILASKSMARTNEDLENHVNLSLKRFGVDFIDLYQFHNVSDLNTLDKVLAANGLLSVLEKAKQQGKIRHIGITSHQLDTARAAVQTDRFETIMFPFNFITSEPVTELLPLARKHDVGFIAMKPLSGGRLTDINMAFNYLFQFPDVLPIPGIEKNAEIDEIFRVMQWYSPLTAVEKARIEQIRTEMGNRFCRRCEYCQPCTAGIPISGVLFTPTIMLDVPKDKWFSGRLADLIGKVNDCTDCGECESRCPYHLPVRELMKELASNFAAEKAKFEASQA